MLLGSLSSTFAVLWTQQRCSPAVLADFVLMRFDVSGHFDFDGLGEHLTCSLAQ
jgi:hypothetical protein